MFIAFFVCLFVFNFIVSPLSTRKTLKIFWMIHLVLVFCSVNLMPSKACLFYLWVWMLIYMQQRNVIYIYIVMCLSHTIQFSAFG